MPPAARVMDLAFCPADSHGCIACAHPVVGPIVKGSPDVFTNGMNAARKGDPGLHAPCCGPNKYEINAGSATVFINDKAAARLTDETKHCGGTGKIIMGSANVIIGDAGGGGGGGGASTGGGVGKGKLKPADLAPSSQIEHRLNELIAKAKGVGFVGPGGEGETPAETPPEPTPGQESLIEVQVVNAGGTAQANVFFELELPDGTKRSGTTGADGFIRLSVTPQTGEVNVRLPDHEPPEEGS